MHSGKNVVINPYYRLGFAALLRTFQALCTTAEHIRGNRIFDFDAYHTYLTSRKTTFALVDQIEVKQRADGAWGRLSDSVGPMQPLI